MTHASQPHPQRCLCQGVCSVYQDGFKLSHNTCPLTGCEHDTRTHSSQPVADTIPRNAREAMTYLESVESEFEKHFRYAEGKEYEIWGTALNRVREALLRAKGEKLQELNPCEENGCTDIENCDEICQHSRIYSPIQMQAARNAERERVLNAVKEHCQKGIFNMNQCVVNDIKGNPIDEVHTQRADERRETYKDIIRLSESIRGGER